jgi:hypothetical protein
VIAELPLNAGASKLTEIDLALTTVTDVNQGGSGTYVCAILLATIPLTVTTAELVNLYKLYPLYVLVV